MNKRSPLVSIIIVTFNSQDWIIACVDSVIKQKHPHQEIVIIDNNSQDATVAKVRHHFPAIKIISNRNNLGCGAAFNQGIAHSLGEYIFLINPDTIVHPNCLKILVKEFESDISIAAAQGTIISLADYHTIQSCGVFYNSTGILTPNLPQPATISNIFAISGPSIFLRRTALIPPLFDETFFLYFEEVDVCWHLWLKNKRVVYIPQAILYHEGAVHTRNLPYEKILMQSIRNRLLSYTKNAGLKNVCIALITQGSISLLAIAVLILKGKVAYALAFILAWINYAKLLPHTLKQRFRIQKQRRVSDIFLTKISKPITFSQLLSLAK